MTAVLKNQAGATQKTCTFAASCGVFSPSIGTISWYSELGYSGSSNSLNQGNTLYLMLDAYDCVTVDSYTSNGNSFAAKIYEAIIWDFNTYPDVWWLDDYPGMIFIFVQDDNEYCTGTLEVRLVNDCGDSDSFYIPAAVITNSSSSSSSTSSRSTITAYPNPVSGILTVEIEPAQRSSAGIIDADITYDVRLYDRQGNILRQTKTKDGNIDFNVYNLPVGVYYLHVHDGVSAVPEMRRIVVER